MDEPQIDEPHIVEDHSVTSNTRLVYLIIALVVVAIASYFYLYIYVPLAPTVVTEEETVPMAQAEKSDRLFITGDAYLTVGTVSDSAHPIASVYHSESQTIESLPISESVVSMFPVPVGSNQILYYSAPYIPNDMYPLPYTDYLEVYLLDLDTKESKLISDEDISTRRRASVSPNQEMYAFTALSEDATADDDGLYSDLSSWSVYVDDLHPETPSTMISAGASPVWLSDTELLFVHADGLTVYNLTSNSSYIVKGVTLEYTANLMIALAPDKRNIAALNDNADRLSIITLREDSFGDDIVYVANLDSSLKVPRGSNYWPSFSLDGNLVSFTNRVFGSDDTKLIVANIDDLDLASMYSFTDTVRHIPVSPVWKE